MANNFALKLTRFDREYLEDLQRFLYPYIFTLAEGTRERIDERLKSAGLVDGEPYVAVHVRRGDKISGIHRESEGVEIGSYADSARPFLALGGEHDSASLHGLLLRELRAANASVLYVASDDGGAAEELSTELGGRIRVVRQERGSEGSYTSRGYEADEDIMGVLSDVEALRRASAFIGTASSNVGRLVFFLRPKGSVSISLDKRGKWMWRLEQGL